MPPSFVACMLSNTFRHVLSCALRRLYLWFLHENVIKMMYTKMLMDDILHSYVKAMPHCMEGTTAQRES